MTRWSRIRLCSAMMVLIASLASACDSRSGGGPLTTLLSGGQPVFAVAAISTLPGQAADMTASGSNSAPGQVTLVSATLMPVAGQPAGRLSHVAVGTLRGYVAAARGRPPGVTVRPLPGAVLPQGQSNIIFGFAGNHDGGVYITTGLKVVYRYHGQIFTVDALSAAANCVVKTLHTPFPFPRCEQGRIRADRAAKALAGR
jgi:hypothetical protein